MSRTIFSETSEEEKMSKENELPRVKQFVRVLSSITSETTQSVQEVDEEINAWLAQGYKLFATHFVSFDATNIAYTVLYILVRE